MCDGLIPQVTPVVTGNEESIYAGSGLSDVESDTKQGSHRLSSENLSSARTQSSVDNNKVPVKKQSASVVATENLSRAATEPTPTNRAPISPEPAKKTTTSTGTSPLPQDISTQVTRARVDYHLKVLERFFFLDLRRGRSGYRKEKHLERTQSEIDWKKRT